MSETVYLTHKCLLEMRGISKSFPGVKALSEVNFKVYAGKVMALIGENGAGKSTLMKILSGSYSKDVGEIYLNDILVNFTNPLQSQSAGISIIHQELNLIPFQSIAENIFLGREFTNCCGFIDWSKTYLEADKLLAKVKLNKSSKLAVESLTIAEQQLVEIAKALSFNSQVIIMDEPTDALTATETANLFKIIHELKQQGCGIVYISHRLAEIFTICDDITVFRDGQLIKQTSATDIDENDLIELMVGRKITNQYPTSTAVAGAVMLEVKNLSAVDIYNISFSAKQGEILGVSGLLGAKRTELMQIIYGNKGFISGGIQLNGQAIQNKTPIEAILNGIIYISEDRKKDGLVLTMNVKENITLSALNYFKNKLDLLDLTKEQNIANEYVQKLKIKTPNLQQEVGLLSGGNQQKISIAKGLILKPKVLILDEPTRGIDVAAKYEIYKLMNELKQQGLSIIMISSDMSEIMGMSDRVMVMSEGTITGFFEPQLHSQEQIMAAAFTKTAAKEEKIVA